LRKPAGTPLRVALHSGLFVERDAISGSVTRKLEVLDRLRTDGWPLDVTVFAQHSDRSDPRVQCVPDVGHLIRHPAFHAADLHVFEFGIHYSNFDAVYLTSPDQYVAAVYHNITPPHLLSSSPRTRNACERALLQRENLHHAHEVLCVSEFNMDDLLTIGIPADRLRVLHLPPNVSPFTHPVTLPARPPNAPIQILYVGRMVEAKGLRELLASVPALNALGVEFEITLAGDRRHSPSEFLKWLDAARTAPGSANRIRVESSPNDTRLAMLYADADILAIPSHHERYCIPVVEGLAFGCLPVTSDAGNLPNIVDDCGLLAPAHDGVRFADTLAAAVIAVHREQTTGDAHLPIGGQQVPFDDWRRRAETHVASYSHQTYANGMTALLQRAALHRNIPLPPTDITP